MGYMQIINWYPLLPESLIQSAYKTRNEMALYKEQALEIVEILDAKGLQVCDIEPWLPILPRPTPLGNDWSLRRAKKNNRLARSVVEFISNFNVPEVNDVVLPVFNIYAELKS